MYIKSIIPEPPPIPNCILLPFNKLVHQCKLYLFDGDCKKLFSGFYLDKD